MPKVGDKIRIIHLELDDMYDGEEGVVEEVSDGYLYGSWGPTPIDVAFDEYEIIK